MAVTESHLRRIAELARVGIDEARVPELVAELNHILSHMDVLQRVDVSMAAVAPVSPSARLRDDITATDLHTMNLAAFAPAERDGFFLVPRLETHSDVGSDGDTV